MTKKQIKEFRVFFSWQSDSPKATNCNAIRSALKSAEKNLLILYPELKIVIDEATRNTSGSPNIATKILEKIKQADMLVCDVTTINPGENRSCPNPNVTYELGFSMALLGEERIVMLFNQAHGNFPSDLPFDFIQNRISTYNMPEPVTSENRLTLAKLMQTAVRAVIEKNPKTPEQLKGLSRDNIEHAHDVKNMKWLMSKIHLPTIDDFISRLPHYISEDSLWFWEDINAIMNTSRFSLYDKKLDASVKNFYNAWRLAISHSGHYHDTPGGQLHVFTNPGDLPLTVSKQKVWDKIEKARKDMFLAYTEILDRLRTYYIEVNIPKLSDKAWIAYRKETRKENEDTKNPGKKPSTKNKKKSKNSEAQ